MRPVKGHRSRSPGAGGRQGHWRSTEDATSGPQACREPVCAMCGGSSPRGSSWAGGHLVQEQEARGYRLCLGLHEVWFSLGAFTRSFCGCIWAAVHRLYLWFPPPAGQKHGSSFPLLCSLLPHELVLPEANPCHLLTRRADASFLVLRGRIDLKTENKQCLHCPGLSLL